MDANAKALIQQGDYLFGKKMPVLTFWQEIADNFYPERADFTATRQIGYDFAANLTTSYPILASRELGQAISGMLRPTQKDWFKQSVYRDDRLDNQGRVWLERMTRVQKRAMYHPAANFVKATKEGDRDFSTFGQCAISTELNRDRNGLLYKCHHLRDLAWSEGYDGTINSIHHKMKWTGSNMAQAMLGRGKIHHKVQESLDKSPHKEWNVRRIIIRAEDYDHITPGGAKRFNTPWISVYVDVDNEHVMEEVGVRTPIYTIPRWQTVSGSQYATSPCTVAALPDARLIQAMVLTLLEAGEKAVNPPMAAKQDVIRSDVSIFAGGITWLDADYDERLGDAIRPMGNDYSGIPLGMDMHDRIKATIMEAFYLNKLNLPPSGPDMTAFEVAQRVQEYIRTALPLFEPMEDQYSGSLCMQTFDLLLDGGAFGSVYDMPASLRGQDVQFVFESPLHEAVDRQLGHTFQEAQAMLATAAALDKGAPAILDARVALRDVLNGIGVPAAWQRDEQQLAEIEAKEAQANEMASAIAQIQAGGVAAEAVGKGGAALKSLQTPVPV